MNFFKALFGGKEQTPEEEKQEQEQKNFELLKYDGMRAAKMGQLDFAVKCCQKALEMQDDLEVRDCLAHSLLRVGRLQEALEQYRLLTEAEPDNQALWLQIAQVAYMEEDYAQMAEAAGRAIALDEGSAQAHYMQAQACLGQRDLVGAIAQLTKSIALDESLGEARLLRAQTLLGMGDVSGAASDADYLMEHAGEHEDVLMLKARVEKAEGRAAEALLIYNKVIDLNPFMVEAYQERGRIKFEQGDTAGAKEDADKVLELNPQQLADVSGDYSAEGIEQRTRQAYSAVNPFGL